MSKPQGWRNESARHSLAARGISTDYVPPKYRKKGYEVYLNGVYQGFTKDREEAEEVADQIGGCVVDSKNRRKILYRSSNKNRHQKNPFELYSGDDRKIAERNILQAIQKGDQKSVVDTAKRFVDQGAMDTTSREAITSYWDKMYPNDPFNYNIWYR